MDFLLHIKNLTVTVREPSGRKVLLDRMGLQVPSLSVTALVGGSGSGKTTAGLSVLRLLPPALKIESGEIIFEGEDLLKVPYERMRHIRGGKIGMVFQDPLEALNPVFSIGYQIDEVLSAHTPLSRALRKKRVVELLDLAGLPDPRRVASEYPHQLSGGMRQRAMIAQTLAAGPKLIIADEPTSSLDVTLQARVMELFKKLKDEFKLSVLLITHDLGLVARMADHVAVMTGGAVVEAGATGDVLGSPRHIYTRTLMDASV